MNQRVEEPFKIKEDELNSDVWLLNLYLTIRQGSVRDHCIPHEDLQPGRTRRIVS